MTTRSRPAPAREKLLDAAGQLFYASGTTATGIDAITAAAGVAKKSLYNNFASKDELVLAYLETRHAEWLDLYSRRLAQASAPEQRVLAVVDAYLDHARLPYPRGFRGCGLLNAAAELPTGAPGREAVRRHKEQVEALLATHLTEGGATDPQGMAEHLAFLLEGAMVRAGLECSDEPLVRARQIAVALVSRR